MKDEMRLLKQVPLVLFVALDRPIVPVQHMADHIMSGVSMGTAAYPNVLDSGLIAHA